VILPNVYQIRRDHVISDSSFDSSIKNFDAVFYYLSLNYMIDC
jgi:hypothetical protein